MPFTPFHWSILIFGLVFSNVFYIPALAISSVIMDIEPFYYLFLDTTKNDSIHGFFHTYLGVTIVGVVTAFVLIKVRNTLDQIMRFFKLEQKNINEKHIYFSSLFAAYSHVFLDSLMHADLKPFWPITNYNPFLGLIEIDKIYYLTGVFILTSFIFYIVITIKKR